MLKEKYDVMHKFLVFITFLSYESWYSNVISIRISG